MAQPQYPPSGGQTPPLPTAHTRKRQRTTDQSPRTLGDAPSRTPPQASDKITIREPTSDTQPTAQVETNVTSSSQQETGWQTISRLDNDPFPVTASVRTWAQGEGGWITRSLAQGLLSLEDVHFFSGGADELLANRLQWHTIAVIFYPTLYVGAFCRCVIKSRN